ncbi:MAG: hypothetical protein IPM74_18075 [Crocinitomicaceae bacterium]|nr:hypothetical protein [Crocinitomicaceae bacterium]
MTYRDYLDFLKIDLNKKRNRFIELEKQIWHDGYGDLAVMTKYPSALTEFQFAHNAVSELESLIAMKLININDEFTAPENI